MDVQFQDCRNPRIRGLVCEQVGDDGLAFYKRSTAAANVEGGFASQIMVRKTETSGISVWGQPNVVVEDFCIEDTNGAALQVRYTTGFDTAYIRNVRFAHGRLENCGTYQRKGGAAYFTDGYGIHVHSLPSGVAAPAADVTFEDIDIVNAKESSVYIELNTGKVTLKNIWCKGGAQTAGNLGGAVVASAPIATLDDVEVSDVPGTGFRFYDFGKVILGHPVAHDVAQKYTHSRAFSSDVSGVVLNGNWPYRSRTIRFPRPPTSRYRGGRGRSLTHLDARSPVESEPLRLRSRPGHPCYSTNAVTFPAAYLSVPDLYPHRFLLPVHKLAANSKCVIRRYHERLLLP
jgi:hypothetical protein